MLDEMERSKAARADATGARNIRIAQDLRRSLRLQTARRSIHARDAHEIAGELRDSFRDAIQGKLVLPASLAKLSVDAA
jgi:hypothetical protein